MNNNVFHFPVLLDEICKLIEGLPVKSDLIYIDSTLGEGIHAKEILKKYDFLSLVGIERDSQILERAKQFLIAFEERITYVNDWFDNFFLNYPLNVKADFILVDLGISMFHYKGSKRGFTFLEDEPLDMRLCSSSCRISAAEVVNTFSKYDLEALIYDLSNEYYSRRISKAIVEYRKIKKIQTTKELQSIINKVYPVSKFKINPATKTFQALRIYVNDELARLKKSLPLWVENLAKDGILAIITFHSIEDRIVKDFFKSLNCDLYAKVSKKPIIPSFYEIKKNKPSRSAKLRAVKKNE
ncbi:16S rRNA (cytosine(1402)-N(4))-methyltransferase RsmH [Borrelia sp. CA_690]|uniref:Ribosomal RNA small subunit methyltransferase H n=1 Tax=Borrelia maritima TaxID=2761123 RepID=A0A5J6WBM3_9SPIR|nr:MULTISPECIES: 16S rRNA (cytosine(1402)-N(4))-methyltransferase RsmH [Borrelia]QFI14441.1 16S rRNA (cytosine(1402)-N(4))-methyltransferase RsmH [Borrelia maritima]WKC84296.1 16S rRNA (cytosine(1402)-N(4))-methyltransferase RsmH [Borrelia sp. CA_690]